MNRYWRLLLIALGLLLNITVAAQVEYFAATVLVIADDVTFLRASAQNEIQLNAGAVTVFGIGDNVRTGENGRALIRFSETSFFLLLPNSEYQLTNYSQQPDEIIALEATLTGIAVHQFPQADSVFNYTVGNDTLTVTTSNESDQRFAVWTVPDGLQAATVATGRIHLQQSSDEAVIEIGESSGYAIPYSEGVVELSSPLHASQVVGLVSSCTGIVNTSGSEGLRIRGGAALDYVVVDVRQDGDEVSIVGTTENGLWYRIPFQTGFGWMFSNLMIADCGELPVSPNLFREDPEQISNVTAMELEILEPFYGLPSTNTTFYDR